MFGIIMAVIFFGLVFFTGAFCISYIMTQLWSVVKKITNNYNVKMDKMGNLITIAVTGYWLYRMYISLETYGDDLIGLMMSPIIISVIIVLSKKYING